MEYQPRPFYGETLFTVPILGWRVVETPQGWSYEFDDGTHDWPSPRERQLLAAYRRSSSIPREARFDVLVEAVNFALKYHRMQEPKGNGLPAQLVSSLVKALELAKRKEADSHALIAHRSRS